MTVLLISRAALTRSAERLAALGEGLTFLVLDDDGSLVAEPQGPAPSGEADIAWLTADAYFGDRATVFIDILRGSQTLRWVQVGAAGADYPLFHELAERGVTVTTSHGQAIGIAEYVLAGVFDVLQNGNLRRRLQQQRQWTRVQFREIYGTRWMIVGMGSIGRQVASRAQAMGAECVGIGRRAGPATDGVLLAGPEDVRGLLPTCDVVVLCCPLTPATRHMADAVFFASMKPGTVFVNVGRGGLVDETALLAALDKDHAMQAVLDVFETEPLPDDSRFWNHPRVKLTAHTSGNSSGLETRNDRAFFDNLARYLHGEQLHHVAF